MIHWRPFATLLLVAAILMRPAMTHAADDPGWSAALQDWESVLVAHVDAAGRPDFAGLSRQREALDRFVAYLASHGPRTTPTAFPSRESALAFHINAYNALAMVGVINEGIPADFGTFFKRASFFRFRAVVVDGQRTNLYDYENKIIRPLNEPRTHFALNCMVRACPRLPQEPFRLARLEAQLESVTREFFASSLHLQVDPAQREVRVSQILEFYTEDFAPSGKLQELSSYISRYRDPPIPPGYRIRFIPYDWTVNRQLLSRDQI
jgi:hypothetical protein